MLTMLRSCICVASATAKFVDRGVPKVPPPLPPPDKLPPADAFPPADAQAFSRGSHYTSFHVTTLGWKPPPTMSSDLIHKAKKLGLRSLAIFPPYM